MKISPKYKLELIKDVNDKLFKDYRTYSAVETYIRQWYEYEESHGYEDDWENFSFVYKDKTNNIDTLKTLATVEDDELLFKIAIDLGLEIPGLIYSIPEIKGLKADSYSQVSNIFENALKKVYSEPDIAITMANSALETIIKHICSDSRIEDCNPRHTLQKLTAHILKQFKIFPDKKLEDNIKQLGSSFMSISQAVETLRSDKTKAHGKHKDDYIIDDPLYAMLIVNSVTTVGLFLINYYEKKFKVEEAAPFDIEPDFDDDIPF